jgi:hypothetical protein
MAGQGMIICYLHPSPTPSTAQRRPQHQDEVASCGESLWHLRFLLVCLPPAASNHNVTQVKIDRRGPKDRPVFFNQIVAVFEGWNDSRNNGARALTDSSGQVRQLTLSLIVKPKSCLEIFLVI